MSHQTVAALLDDLGYSLQANRKTKEGQDHADRDAQFEYISRQVWWCLPGGRPTGHLSRRQEEGKHRGFSQSRAGERHRRRRPEEVRAKDFPDKRLGKAIPEESMI